MEKHKSGFGRNMKPAKSGSGTKEKKPYYLTDALQFTVPYIKALGKPSGNLSQPPPEEEEGPALLGDDGNNDDDLSEIPLPSPSPLPSTQASKSSSRTSSVTSTLPQHQDHQSDPKKQHNMPNKKKRPAKYDDVDKAFIEYLDRKRASPSAEREHLAREPREEALKMFLLSFLPDLMKMDDGEVRQFKRKTLDAVDDIMSARSRPPSSSSCPSLSNVSSISNQMPPPTTSRLEGYDIQEGGDDSFSTLAAYYSTAFQQNT